MLAIRIFNPFQELRQIAPGIVVGSVEEIDGVENVVLIDEGFKMSNNGSEVSAEVASLNGSHN